MLWFSVKFNGWKPLTDTESEEDVIISIPHHLTGEGTIELGRDSGSIAYVVVGSPAFRKGKKGYALSGKLRYVAAGSEGDPVMLKMVKPIVDTIGTDAVMARITLEAVMRGSETDAPVTRCTLAASLVFQREGRLGIERRTRFRIDVSPA